VLQQFSAEGLILRYAPRKAVLALALGLATTASFGAAYGGPVKVLYSFKGGTDGAIGQSALISDNEGNLYGTTATGGSSGCNGRGCGTVFRLSPDGTETVLYAFRGGSDGSGPLAVSRDRAGNLYGVTHWGGDTAGQGRGTVFRLAPDGTETLLHIFRGGADGAYPLAGLLVDKSGNLFGTTVGGGNPFCETFDGCGTIFRISPDGKKSLVYSFCAQPNCADGLQPQSQLIADREGNLYGTTVSGGSNVVGGTVFRIAPDRTETVLYSFCSTGNMCTDGAEPYTGVTMDKTGNLYGTTYWGGAWDYGSIFELANDGTETVLHSFLPQTDGANPVSGVIVDAAGSLYGTLPLYTFCKNRLSIVYRLSPNGGEKLRCVNSNVEAGLLERDSVLYGAGESGGKYGEGFVFAIKKQ